MPNSDTPRSAEEPREHDLKCWPEYYDAIDRNEKPFEYRLNDRDYRVGDILHLRRFDPDTPAGPQYTGQSLRRRVTYMLDRRSTTFPIADGYCILGLEQRAAPAAERDWSAIFDRLPTLSTPTTPVPTSITGSIHSSATVTATTCARCGKMTVPESVHTCSPKKSSTPPARDA